MNSQLNAYRETRVKTAGQGRLIVMLYDEGIKQLDWVIEEFKLKKPHLDKINESLCRAQDVVTELMASLDFDKGKDIAQNLLNLYMFFNKQLLEANLKKDVEIVKAVRRMMNDLRSAWSTIVSSNPSSTTSRSGVNIAG